MNRKFPQEFEDTFIRNIGQFRVRHSTVVNLLMSTHFRPEWRGQSLLQEGTLQLSPLQNCSVVLSG